MASKSGDRLLLNNKDAGNQYHYCLYKCLSTGLTSFSIANTEVVITVTATNAKYQRLAQTILRYEVSGLAVSMLASGTRVRGFKPGRSRRIFRASEKSSACLPSEGKWKNLSHVPALRHVKEPSASVNYECASKIPCIVPSFAGRGLSWLCGAWRLWWWMRGTQLGKGTIGLQAAVPKWPYTRPLTFFKDSWIQPELSFWHTASTDRR